MKDYKYTQVDIDKASKYSRNALFIILCIFFVATMPGIFFDEDLPLKDKIIGILINSSVLAICYFVGETFRKRYIKKKAKELLGQKNKTVSKGIAFLMLILAISVLVLYFLEIIHPIVFIILGTGWVALIQVILKSTKLR